jgi:excisionase family DNA binding protein
MPGIERLAYSVEEVCDLTGLSRSLVYDQMNAGRLDYIKVGRRRLVGRHHLDAFLGVGIVEAAA